MFIPSISQSPPRLVIPGFVDLDDEVVIHRPPRIHEYFVSAWQRDFISDTATPAYAAVCGIGAGKSWALMRVVGELLRINARSGTVGGIFSAAYDQLAKAVLPHLWKFFDEVGFRYGEHFVYNERPPAFWQYQSEFHSHERVLTVKPWGQAIVKSLSNPDAARGPNLGWAVVDETRECSREGLDVVMGRIRDPRSRTRVLRVTTSPNGFDFVYEFFAEKQRPGRKLIQAATIDNPFIPPDVVERLKESYDARFFEQEVLAKFISIAQGQAYRCFDRTVHVVPLTPAPDAAWQVCYDFNRIPFSIALCQDQKDGKIGVVSEISLIDADTASATKELIARLDPYRPSAIHVYGDPAGHQKSTKSNSSDWYVVEQVLRARYGSKVVMNVGRAQPPVMERVNAVNAALRNANGDVRLVISTACEKLRRDFERVVFRPGTKELNKTADATLTHISDALSYYIAKRLPVYKRYGDSPVTTGYV